MVKRLVAIALTGAVLASAGCSNNALYKGAKGVGFVPYYAANTIGTLGVLPATDLYELVDGDKEQQPAEEVWNDYDTYIDAVFLKDQK